MSVETLEINKIKKTWLVEFDVAPMQKSFDIVKKIIEENPELDEQSVTVFLPPSYFKESESGDLKKVKRLHLYVYSENKPNNFLGKEFNQTAIEEEWDDFREAGD